MMAKAERRCLSTGCRPRSGRHPVAFAGREHERRGARDDRVGRGGRAGRGAGRRPARRRPGARAPAHRRVAWIREELARVGEAAGLFRRGDRLLAEPIPDVDARARPAPDRGQRAGGGELAAIQRVLAAARQVHADLRRVAETAPLAARARVARSPTRRIERRLEQSVDADGDAARHREPRGSPRLGARCTRPGSGCSGGSSRCSADSTPARRRPTPP